MNRRDFNKLVFGGLLIPGVSTPKSVDWTLRFEQVRDDKSFVPLYHKIIKGPYESTLCITGGNLKDSSGLCQVVELAHIIRDELEFGSDGMRKLLSLGWDCPEQERNLWKKKLRQLKLTDSEFKQIIGFMQKLCGRHDCVYKNRKEEALRLGFTHPMEFELR